MRKQTPAEKLDKLIGQLQQPGKKTLAPENSGSGEAIELARLAGELRVLPRPEFKTRLRANLERRATMATAAKAVPETQTKITPYLSVKGALAAIEFYKKAFGATEGLRFMQPDGRVGHAEISIGEAKFMLADEFPEIGFRSPQSLGGSSINIHLNVPDVDVLGRQAVAAGAKVVRPVADQFYGERSGHFADPFGYTWVISTQKEALSTEEMHRRAAELNAQQAQADVDDAKSSPTEKLRHLMPYVIISRADKWLEFVKDAFGAEEIFRAKSPDGKSIMHAEVKIGHSIIEVGDTNDQNPPMPTAMSLRVDDVDAIYRKGLEAGATSLQAPSNPPYGGRGASLRDPNGNHWYIFKSEPGSDVFHGFGTVTPYLHPVRAGRLIEFLQRAFGAEETYRAESPDGVVHHAQVRIGDSVIGMGDAHGIYQQMPSTLHFYVRDVDSVYQQALRAGAKSIRPPENQPYGERNAGVQDAFGNHWWIATPLGSQS